MKDQTREEPKILAAAERRMQAWSLAQEIADRMIRVDKGQQVARPVHEFITISREAGAGAEQIAKLLGGELGWEVLDKELVDRVAERYRLSREMLELVDETESNWAYDTWGPWLDPKIIPHEKYFVHVSRVILAAARRGNVVLVGRGAQFLLPPEQGLRVRVVASEKHRLENLMRRHDMTADMARQLMHDLDRGRADLVEHFFHRDVADPHLYDLVINADHIEPATAVELIVAAYRRRQAASK